LFRFDLIYILLIVVHHVCLVNKDPQNEQRVVFFDSRCTVSFFIITFEGSHGSVLAPFFFAIYLDEL